jgi:hypothetical protein
MASIEHFSARIYADLPRNGYAICKASKDLRLRFGVPVQRRAIEINDSV